MTLANPLVNFVAPYQTVCNYAVYFLTPLGTHQSEAVPAGTYERVMLNGTNHTQPNRVSTYPASRPADVPADQDPQTAKDAAGDPLTVTHAQPYSPAIDARGQRRLPERPDRLPRRPAHHRQPLRAHAERQLEGARGGRRQPRGHGSRYAGPRGPHLLAGPVEGRQEPEGPPLMRRNRKRQMTPFAAGLVALVLVCIGTYFAFTRGNAFKDKFELYADVRNANNLKARSDVRIAGVNVGKVASVSPGETASCA